MPTPGPLTQVGQQGFVVVNGQPLTYVPGSYTCEEAPRFGEKISTGSLRYADFNPYESAHSISTLVGGYGLRDYTDLPEPFTQSQQYSDTQGLSRYLESDGIDCRDGKIILGPYLRPITLPGIDADPIWIGEFPVAYGKGAYGSQTVLLCVAGTHIWVINTDYSATLLDITLPAAAQAVAVFGSTLIFGFGASTYAVYTEDLSGYNQVTQGLAAGITTRNPIYIYALATDQAAVYAAGGPATTNTNTVMSSSDGVSDYDTTLTYCGGDDAPINSLAPGGGVFLVLVGKTNELGAIDLNGIYRTLMPFDSRLSTNCTFLKWALGVPGRESQGPISVFLPRDGNLMQFQPTSSNSGSARNVSPWAEPGIRPLNIRGNPVAFQGTARYGYWALTSKAGKSWVIARDQKSGAHHPIISLGTNSCHALGLSGLIPAQTGDLSPHLFIGQGHGVVTVDLPIDGEYPPDSSNCLYVAQGTLDLPAITLNFPDENKINFYVRVIAANLLPGQRTVEVSYAYDDDTTYTSLGFISESPAGEVTFPIIESSKRVKLRLTLRTDDITKTPEVQGLSVRMSLNSKLYRIWSFQAYVPVSTQPHGAADLQNPQTLINALWRSREDGLPVNFVDRWNIPWVVRPLKIKETETIREPTKVIETVMDLAFLQFAPGAGSIIYDDAAGVYDDEDQRWG